MPRYRIETPIQPQPPIATIEPPLRPDWRNVLIRPLPEQSELNALLLQNPKDLYVTTGAYYPWIGIASDGEIMLWGPKGYKGVYGPGGELLPPSAQIRYPLWGKPRPPRPSPQPPPKWIWKPRWLTYWGVPIWGGGWDVWGNWFLYE